MLRALHDPLTNLPNRSLFLDRLRHAEARAVRAGTAVGLLFVDLDGFKPINDSLGHARGDELPIAVAARISDALRAGDTAARLGGDEFAVLVDGLEDEGGAVLVAKRMLAALREPVVLGVHEIAARASIGVATARGPGGNLLRDADLAMYQAKSRGRDRVVSFDGAMHAAMVASVAMEPGEAADVVKDRVGALHAAEQLGQHGDRLIEEDPASPRPGPRASARPRSA